MWYAEAFNTTSVVVVRGKTSRVPFLSVFSCTAARASPRLYMNSASARLLLRAAPAKASLRRRLSAEYRETSCERLTLAMHRLLLNASRLLYLSSLPGASRAGCWLHV